MALNDLLKDEKGMTFGEALKGLVVIVVGVGALAIVILLANNYFGGGVERRDIYQGAGKGKEEFIKKGKKIYFSEVNGLPTLEYIESLNRVQDREKTERRPGYESPKPLR